MEVKCSVCGRVIVPGNDENGLPNGVGFVKDGAVVNICAKCLCEIGKRKCDEDLRGEK